MAVPSASTSSCTSAAWHLPCHHLTPYLPFPQCLPLCHLPPLAPLTLHHSSGSSSSCSLEQKAHGHWLLPSQAVAVVVAAALNLALAADQGRSCYHCHHSGQAVEDRWGEKRLLWEEASRGLGNSYDADSDPESGSEPELKLQQLPVTLPCTQIQDERLCNPPC